MTNKNTARAPANGLAILTLAAIALTTLLSGLQGCTALRDLEPPEVVVTSIRPLDATLMEQRFDVDLRIYNPNNRDLSIEGVDFELDLNGKRLARGAGATDLALPRLGEAETTVRVSSSFLGLARQLMSAGETESLTYRMKGRIHLRGGGALPFDKSGELGTLR